MFPSSNGISHVKLFIARDKNVKFTNLPISFGIWPPNPLLHYANKFNQERIVAFPIDCGIVSVKLLNTLDIHSMLGCFDNSSKAAHWDNT